MQCTEVPTESIKTNSPVAMTTSVTSIATKRENIGFSNGNIQIDMIAPKYARKSRINYH